VILREHLYIFALLDYRRENTSNMFRIITKFQFHVYSLASEIEIPIEYTRNTNFRDRYLYIYVIMTSVKIAVEMNTAAHIYTKLSTAARL